MEDLPAKQIQQILGRAGKVKRGALSVSVPRPEPIIVHEVELPAVMGMATVLNFQAATDGKVVATGDFVMIAEEVSRVCAVLARHGIEVTALHNHVMHGSPVLYFLHFWAHETPDTVAQGLRAALDVLSGK
jgi:hypothetical protein